LRREIARDGAAAGRGERARAPLTARLDGREPTDGYMNEAAEISVTPCVCLQEIQNPIVGDDDATRRQWVSLSRAICSSDSRGAA
jgi:hypothetical protein